MLVITRRPNQSLHIGRDVTVTVIQVKGNDVRIAIDAPRHVRVLRGEILHRGENESPGVQDST